MAGFLEGKVTVPGIGPAPKPVVYGAAAVLGVLAIVYLRNRKASSATSATSAAGTGSSGAYPPDGTSGNPSDPYSIDPATGITYGDEQAAAAQASSPYGGGGGGGGSYPSNLYPWDGTSGNPQDPFSMDPSTGQTYGDEGSAGYPSTTNGGPPFTSNSAWAQYVQNYLTSTVGLDPGTVSAALGAYLGGQPLTSAQQTIVSQAIAFGNNPPVAGPGGYPPALKAQPDNGGGSGPQTAVPNVVGMALADAEAALTAAGFTYQVTGGSSGTVKSQSPAGGTAASSGTLVTLTVKAASSGGGGGGGGGGAGVIPFPGPSLDGMTVAQAQAAAAAAGFQITSITRGGQEITAAAAGSDPIYSNTAYSNKTLRLGLE